MKICPLIVSGAVCFQEHPVRRAENRILDGEIGDGELELLRRHFLTRMD
jgi:hypothetical protein